MINLKKIETKYQMNMGAPAPKILCNDNQLVLIFYIDLFDKPKFTDKIKERNINSDVGLALIKFDLFRIYKFYQ